MDPLEYPPPLERSALRLHTRSPQRHQSQTKTTSHTQISDLSPTSTVEFLHETEAVDSDKFKPPLLHNIVEVSVEERTWGVKAALAAKKVRAWLEEVSAWQWPSETPWEGYVPPQPSARRQKEEDPDTRDLKAEDDNPSNVVKTFHGSLSTSLISVYESRIEEIRQEIDALDLEELKGYTKSILNQSRSRHSSINGFQDLSSLGDGYGHLDDFQGIITVTVIQILPYLTRLDELLDVWAARLMVLRLVPEFIISLQAAQRFMGEARRLLDTQADDSNDSSRDGFIRIEGEAGSAIAHAGRLLDAMLDGLQGHPDTLPDGWIDEFEHLEIEFSSWCVKMEDALAQRMQYEEGAVDGSPRNSDLSVMEAFQELEDRAMSGSVPLITESTQIEEKAEQEQVDKEALPAPSQYAAEKPKLFPLRSPKPSPLILHRPTSSIDSNFSSGFSSGYSAPGSATSGSFSNMSSPEIQSASKAEYFGSPVEVVTPAWHKDALPEKDMLSRQSSQRTERGIRSSLDDDTPNAGLPATRSRSSTFVPGPTIPEQNLQSDSEAEDPSYVRARSASVKSFELVGKNVIKNVMVRRTGSYPSSSSPWHGKNRHSAPAQATSSKGGISEFGRPAIVDAGTIQTPSQPSVAELPPTTNLPGLAALEDPADIPLPSTPIASRPQSRFERYEDYEHGTSPVKVQKMRKPISINQTPLRDSPANIPKLGKGDQLEARISSILEEIPGSIRLTSPTKPPRRLSDLRRTSASHTPSPKFTRAQASLPPSISKAPSSEQHDSDSSDIKLYHLHQAGKDQPIKLFVRLVGENGERVMVRIGGGWADLGEYLKEYAGHHGKRAASDSRYAIENLVGSEASSPATPGSQLQGLRKAIPSSRQSSYAKPAASVRDLQNTLTPPSTRHFDAGYDATSPIVDLSNGSSSRPSSRHSYTDEGSPLGGAGPRAKKVEVSPSKQAWVDGMVEQARKVNSDRMAKEMVNEIGDLGKVGGTRRVFLRASTTR